MSTASFITMAGPLEPSDLKPPTEDDVLFTSYIPPARDAIHMPIHVLYMVLATIIIVMTLYAIIGHLIKDLLHDFAGLFLYLYSLCFRLHILKNIGAKIMGLSPNAIFANDPLT